MNKYKVEIEFENGVKHIEDMTIEEFVKFVNYNRNNENIVNIKMERND